MENRIDRRLPASWIEPEDLSVLGVVALEILVVTRVSQIAEVVGASMLRNVDHHDIDADPQGEIKKAAHRDPEAELREEGRSM